MQNTLIDNRQKMLFNKLISKEIPELFEDLSDITIGNYKVCISSFPIMMQDSIEDTNGTLYLMLKAKCEIENTVTAETHSFMFDVLKIPKYTELGFKIKGNNMQILDLYDRVPGWSFESDLTGEDVSSTEMQDFDKRSVKLKAVDKASLSFGYQKSKGMIVALRHGKLPANVFFRTLTEYSNRELLELFGADNVFVLSAFPDESQTSYKTKASCIDAVYNSIYSNNSSNDTTRNLIDKQTAILRYFFNQRYLNVGASYADRLERFMSFRNRALNKTLAEDISVCGYEVKAGTILSEEILDKLDKLPITEIKVILDKKTHSLKKFSTFTFRALGFELVNAVEGIKAGTVLTEDDLKVLNDSDVEAITVKVPKTKKQLTMTRRVHPKTISVEDLMTAFSVYANILNDYDSFDAPYELSNRIVIPFDKKVLMDVEANVNTVIRILTNELRKVPEDGLILQAITNFSLNTDCFINAMSGSANGVKDNESQMSDMNNSLHNISKAYKVTTDIDTKSVTDDLRKVQDTQLGRTDPIDSPESSKIGLVHERTLMSKETEAGFLTAPYLHVKNGVVISDKPDYLTAQEEQDTFIAEWNETFFTEKDGEKVLKPRIRARYNGNIVSVEPEKVTLKEYSQLQNMSPARSMIPFMGNSNAKRLLMGCNHQKQAVPTLVTERPIVGTGGECLLDVGNYTARSIVQDYYNDMVSLYDGIIAYKDEILASSVSIAPRGLHEGKKVRKVKVIVNKAKELNEQGKINCDYTYTIEFPYLQKTYEKSIFSFRINPKENNVYESDDIVVYNMSYDMKHYDREMVGDYGGYKPDDHVFDNGYGVGRNLVIGYKTFAGSTIDDAICISSDLVFKETLTTITMVSKVVELHENEDKTEVFGLPQNAPSHLKLDSRGLPKVGSVLKQGDAFACVISTNTSNNGVKPNAQYHYLDEFTEGQVVSAEIKEKDKKKFCEVILASRSNAEVGDKMSGRCGNKGVIARVIPAEDMPYNPETGKKLDIILNPLGIPSRMNITQLLEVTLAMCMDKKHKIVTVAPYGTNSLDYVRKQAEEMDVKPVMLCDGRTGQMFKRPINVGIQYMFKLVHMVKKKINAIGLDGPIDPIFSQPLKGQKNNGGQSFGEMETWCLQGIGANKVLQALLTTQSDDIANKELVYSKIEEDPTQFNVIGDNHNDLTFQCFTRSMGVDVSMEDGTYVFRPLTDAKIRSLSATPVVEENDLHSEIIFGPDKKPKDRAANRSKWGYIDLKAEIVSPFWLNKGCLNQYVGCYAITKSAPKPKLSIASANVFNDMLSNSAFVEKTIDVLGYPTIYYKGAYVPEDVQVITGNEAIVYIFKNYDAGRTLEVYRRALAALQEKHKENSDEYVKLVRSMHYLENFLQEENSLADYVISSYPVMPQTYRPLIAGNARNKNSDFDKMYRNILKDAKILQSNVSNESTLNLLKDIALLIGLDSFAGSSSQQDKQRTDLIKWFTGSGNKSKSKHHGKIRENTLSKRLFCSGRSVIIPTAIIDMKPTEIGVPLAMLLKMYKQPLISYLTKQLRIAGPQGRKTIKDSHWTQLFNALGAKNIRKFKEVYLQYFSEHCQDVLGDDSTLLTSDVAYERILNLVKDYIEGNGTLEPQVVIAGRQPSLHVFSIRAFHPKVVYTKAIQIHPLVCSGYNADFDGDTMWVAAILPKDAQEEAINLMSPAEIFVNPKDCSPVMVPAQDIALGVYCATMLKDNVASVYETPEVLDDVRWYSNLEQLKSDLDLCLLEYYTLVIYHHTNGYNYYSTAGRIVFNSLIPDTFTDKPFSNVLELPIPSSGGFSDTHSLRDLKYDGLVAAKGGTRSDIKYCKLSKICEDFFEEYGSDCIDFYQNIVEFGFHASDIFSVTLSLDDIGFTINSKQIKERYDKSLALLGELQEKGVIDEKQYKKRVRALQSSYSSVYGSLTDDVEDPRDLKKIVLDNAEAKKVALEADYQAGLVAASDKKAGITKIYKDANKTIEKILSNSLDRNNNMFIIFDSGSRGNIGQVMQTMGTIGILDKTKTESMETPVTGNYAEGISSFDMHISSYSARTGVASTQNETRTAGHATRTAVYMTNGTMILEDDCGKTNWWYDVQWGEFKDKVLFKPNKEYFDTNLLGKKVSEKDALYGKLKDTLDNGALTDASYSVLGEGFGTLSLIDDSGNEVSIDVSINDLVGKTVSATDYKACKYLKEFLVQGMITNKCLEIIKKAHLQNVETEVGTYRLFYKLDPVVESLLIGREASDVPVNGMPGLKYLQEFDDPNTPSIDPVTHKISFKKIKTITKKTIQYIEDGGFERVPARLLLDCQTKGGLCAHCYGLKYTNRKIPLVGSNVGIESAQALGEPAAQLTMSLFHKGGAAGESVAGGVEVFTHLLSGSNPGGSKSVSARIAPTSGYTHLKKLDSRVLAFIKPEDPDSIKCSNCKMCNNGFCPLDEDSTKDAACILEDKLDYSRLLFENGEYVEAGDKLTDGYVLPDDIIYAGNGSMEELLRKKQMAWLMTYYNTFSDNGIKIMARHFEIMTRLQNLLVTVVDPGETNLEAGQSYEYTELQRTISANKLATANLHFETSNGYEVVTHNSGAITMLSFENVSATLAQLTNHAHRTDKMSPIGSIFIGNDMTDQNNFKPLNKTEIINYDLADNPYDFFDSSSFDNEVEDIVVTKNEASEMQSLGDFGAIDLSALSAFGGEPESNEPEVAEEPKAEPVIEVEPVKPMVSMDTFSTQSIDTLMEDVPTVGLTVEDTVHSEQQETMSVFDTYGAGDLDSYVVEDKESESIAEEVDNSDSLDLDAILNSLEEEAEEVTEDGDDEDAPIDSGVDLDDEDENKDPNLTGMSIF